MERNTKSGDRPVQCTVSVKSSDGSRGQEGIVMKRNDWSLMIAGHALVILTAALIV